MSMLLGKVLLYAKAGQSQQPHQFAVAFTAGNRHQNPHLVPAAGKLDPGSFTLKSKIQRKIRGHALYLQSLDSNVRYRFVFSMGNPG
jgi:hypothetical protein